MTNNTSRLAIVSGASGGIGSTVALALIAQGWSVLCLARQSPPPFYAITHLAHGQMCAYYARPLESADFIYDFSAYLYDLLDNKFDPADNEWVNLSPDLLVIAHGAAPAILPFAAQESLDTMQHVFEVDVMGAAKLCNIVGRYMLERGNGHIAIVSSLHAYQTYPERAPYAVAKAALLGLSRSLALEWGGKGIRTNVLLPWQVCGPRTQRLVEARAAEGEDLLETYKQRSPSRRLIDPQEIADAILWLDRTPSANGMELVLDGGVSQSMWYNPYMEQA